MTKRFVLFAACASLILVLAAAGVAPAGPATPGFAKAFSCSACHGFDGASQSDAVPVLAGMPAWYLKKAIQDYATGKRPAAEMESYAKMVVGLGVDDVANYFAAQTKQPTSVRADPAAVARGKVAAAACALCHGPEGKGDPAKGIPDLTGQPPGYLLNQMQLFKTDKRSPGDPTLATQKALMKQMTEQQFADLAAYYSSLR